MAHHLTESERAASEETHRTLLHRAERLVKFLKMPMTPKEIVAEEIYLIFKAGLAYCGRRLGASFWRWLSDGLDSEISICKDCADIAKSGAHNPCKKDDLPVF